MKQIQRIQVLLYIAAFIGLAVIIYIWRCALSAYIWAGWGGFGGISLEYTAEGERVGQLLLFGPALFLLFLIVLRVVRNIRKKELKIYFEIDIFFFHIGSYGRSPASLCHARV